MDFFGIASASDETYRLLQRADWEPAIRARQFLLELWERGQPFVDHDLPAKAARCLHPHYWELLVANALLTGGIGLTPRAERKTQAGPDLECCTPRLWVEAVAPTRGDGDDAVPEPVPGGGFVPDDPIQMRLAGALRSKLDQYNKYRAADIIRDQEPYLVALSGGALPFASGESGVPYIVRTVFPYGDEYVSVDRQSKEVVGGGFYYEAAVLKKNGSPVDTDLFLRPGFAPISAILYSASNALQFPTVELDRCLLVVHNPMATNPVPRGVLPAHTEYWFDTNSQQLHREQGGRTSLMPPRVRRRFRTEPE